MSESKTPHHRLQEAWRWLSTLDGPMGQRAARGGIWLLSADLLTRFSSAIRMIALSRLLTPADFGLLGVALMIQAWIEAFSGTGIQASLIHHKGDIGPFLDSAWTIGIIRAIAVFALMAAAAPAAAVFFEDPNITPVVIAAGVVPVIWSLANPMVISFRRDLDFRREVTYRTIGTIVGLVVAVVLGFALRNVWALVISLIASRAAEAAGSYWVRPFRPRLSLQFGPIRQLFRFGRWVFWVNLLVLVQRQLDSLVVGKLLGTSDLGFYQVGRQLVRGPLEGLSVQARSVLFPAFSRLEEPRVGVGMVRVTRALAAVLLPLVAGFFLYASSIVPVLLGERWAVSAPVAGILAWVGLIEFVAAPAMSACMATGRPALLVPAGVLRLLATVGGFFLLLPDHGIIGAALAYLAGSIVWYAAILVALMRVSLVRLKQLALLPLKGLLVASPLVLIWAVGPKQLGIGGLAGWIALMGAATLCGAWLCREDWLTHLAQRSSSQGPQDAGRPA